MAITDDDIIAVAEAIEGTTMNEVDALADHLDREPTDKEVDKLQLHLDEYVFMCEVCDWWRELSEIADKSYDQGAMICQECEEL